MKAFKKIIVTIMVFFCFIVLVAAVEAGVVVELQENKASL